MADAMLLWKINMLFSILYFDGRYPSLLYVAPVGLLWIITILLVDSIFRWALPIVVVCRPFRAFMEN